MGGRAESTVGPHRRYACRRHHAEWWRKSGERAPSRLIVRQPGVGCYAAEAAPNDFSVGTFTGSAWPVIERLDQFLGPRFVRPG